MSVGSENSLQKQPSSQQQGGRRSRGGMDHIQMLYETFHLTHEAVKLDELKIYMEESRRIYQECSERFDLVSPYLRKDMSKVLNKFSQTYYFRGRVISNDSGHKKFKPHPTLKKKYMKWRKDIPECELAIEKIKAKKPLWLMRSIKRTIRCHGGSYILPDFFVPKQVWTQRGYQLRYLKEKVDMFKSFTDAMRCAVVAKSRQDGIKDLKTKLKKILENYLKLSDGTKTKSLKKAVSLQEKLIKKITKRRRRSSLMHNLQPNFNEEYVNNLVTFVDSSEFLGQWIDDSLRTNNRLLYASLEDIAQFVYFKILNKIVMKDLMMLLKVFFRRCREQFTTLD